MCSPGWSLSTCADAGWLRAQRPSWPPSRAASVPDLESWPAAGHTVSMKARVAAAGLIHGAARPGSPLAAGGGEDPASARVAEARSPARERHDTQRQAPRPLGLGVIPVLGAPRAGPPPCPRGACPGLAL